MQSPVGMAARRPHSAEAQVSSPGKPTQRKSWLNDEMMEKHHLRIFDGAAPQAVGRGRFYSISSKEGLNSKTNPKHVPIWLC